MKNNKLLIILLVIFIIISLGLSCFILWDKVIKNDESDVTDEVTQTKTTTDQEVSDVQDITELNKEIQSIYEEAYDKLNYNNNGPQGPTEPEGWIDWRTTQIQVGQEGTIGGVRTINALLTDSNKIEQYFTKRAINVLNYYYTDTPYGQDGKYYIYLSNDVESNRLEFLGTVFNTTDSGKEQFEIVEATEDTIVAVAKESNYMGLDQYLIFKKEDGKWKIDMFEYL